MIQREKDKSDETQRVDVNRVGEMKPVEAGFWQRVYVSIFPVLGGLILDFTDFVTFGPIGLYFGFVIGSVIGYLVSRIYGFSLKSTIIWSLLAGVYCTIPGTGVFPIATIISAVSRFNHPPK